MISQQDLDKYKTGMQDHMAIRSFVDKLIEERNDPDVTEERKPVVQAMLIKKVNEAVNEHFISLLKDEDVMELDKLLEAKIPDNELNDFFRKKIENISIEIATALLNFRAAYLYPVWKKQQEDQAKVIAATQEKQKKEVVVDVSQLPPAPIA
jgi:hypothetical protein